MRFLKIKLFFILVVTLIIQLSPPVYGQDENLDSLVTIVGQLPEDSIKVNHLNGLAKTIMYQFPDSSYRYAVEGLELADKLEYEMGIAALTKTLGIIAYMRGDFASALDQYLKSLNIFIVNHDSLNIAHLFNNIGILYDDQKNLDEARRYYGNALEIYKSINDFDGQATIYHNLGVLFIGDGKPDSAITFLTKTLLINRELKEVRLDALAFGNMGYAYMEVGANSYDTALTYFEYSLREFEKIGDVEGIANQHLNMGELLQKEGKYEESIVHLKKSESLSVKNDFKAFLVDDYKFLSKAHDEMGNHQLALNYFRLYKSISDSIFTDEKNEALIQLQAKTEHEIALTKLDIERELQEERLDTAKTQNYLLIAITGLALAVMLVSAYYFLNKHRVSIRLQEQNLENLNQKKEIEKQRKQVTQINKDLKEKNRSLKQLNKEKDYLMHVVAHDLKSPLNQMAGLVQVINFEPDSLTETQKGCLEKIETVSLRLSHMVDKILDIEAIEKKSYNMNFEEVDLREVISETIDEFEPIAKKKHIDLSSKTNGKISLVKLDRQHAMQVFSNLISNAIKFSPPHRNVRVILATEQDKIVTEIHDEGPGLTNEDKQKVFKEFQRLSAQPTGNEVSNGLGLSIVKKYVEAMNGKVWVESDYGHGAKFKVAFQKS